MRILIAPLDWGLGHATRCIPVIRACLAAGHEVDLATCGAVAVLYRGAFPQLPQHDFPSYGIRYPRHGAEMPFWLLRNLPRLMHVMRAEQECAEKIVKSRGIGLIISDNRFGCFSRIEPSIYMTHQLRIAFPFPFHILENCGIRWHRSRARNFREVWVPDFPDFPGLAGNLSHGVHFGSCVKYVGLLSRFEKPVAAENRDVDVLGILSGPEPMRSVLQERLISTLAEIPGRHAVILGTPGAALPAGIPRNISLFSHLETEAFAQWVGRAKHIIARPGYSTVMDMARLGANCTFVPTPGQTEQGYLGKALHRAGYAGLIFQGDLSPQTLMTSMSRVYRIPEPSESASLLASALAAAC